MKIKLLSVVLLSFIIFSCKTSYKVYEIKQLSNKSGINGYYYYLPSNVLKINFEIEREDIIKGPYAEYARQYFGLNNVPLYSSVNYSIKNISVDVLTEPDSNNCFIVVPNMSEIVLQKAKSGIIESFNFNINDNSSNDVNSIFFSNLSKDIDNNDFHNFRKMVDLNVYEKVDTIINKVKVDTTFIIEKNYKTSFIEKSTEQKVKEIVENLSKIKEAEYNLITGEIEAIDKKNIEFMYSELQNLENEYLKLFTGIKNKTTFIYSFYCYPIKDTLTNIYNYKLFSFSNTKGVLDKNSIEGDWIFLELNDKAYNSLVERNVNKNNIKKEKNHGLYYRIPALVDLSIKQGDKKLYSTQKYISQFGITTSLPNDNISVFFDKDTGGLRLIKKRK